ncbi:MAG: 16S rRNA (guanine(527)-N(7))-methyltransferase RsmG [Desulfitobacteriaceae bacterium]
MFREVMGVLQELALEKIGLELNSEQLNQFTLYGEMLLEWNQRMNLTRIVEPQDIIVKHFLDSLVVGKFALGPKICDIGTGAGFPGLPVKIARPDLEVVLVDSLGKRIDFLKAVTAALGLTAVQCVHSRAEDFGRSKEYRELFDCAVSRAVASLPVLLEYSLPVLKVGGVFLAAKGLQTKDEVSECQKALDILGGIVDGIEEFNLGPLAEHRSLVIVRKVRETPAAYPRKAGVPERKPL